MGKCSLNAKLLNDVLTEWQNGQGGRIARTGADSTEHYATMAREPVARFYCTQIATLLNLLGPQLTETARFPNVEFLETTDPALYFDVRDTLLPRRSSASWNSKPGTNAIKTRPNKYVA